MIKGTENEQLGALSFLSNNYTLLETLIDKNAIQIINQNFSTLSLIIINNFLPSKENFLFIQKIRKLKTLYIPIIVITTDNQCNIKEKLIESGADTIVVIPYSQKYISLVITKLISLHESSILSNNCNYDKTTGLFTMEAFFTEAKKLIDTAKENSYVLSCINIENFKFINSQYGIEIGNNIIQNTALILEEFIKSYGGIAGHYIADRFAILYPIEHEETELINNFLQKITKPSFIKTKLRVRIGRYIVNNKLIPISIMFDRASIAENMIKGVFDKYINYYDDSMIDSIFHEQQIVNCMIDALKNKEFEPWFQPQFNHATGALIGAEALVRWKTKKGYISPAEFVPVFEKNGFIYEMDKYIWEQVCIFLHDEIKKGNSPLPVSVNISRRDLFHHSFLDFITELIKKYNIPIKLLRLEVTESAFSTTKGILDKVNNLINLGFTVEIDDFGSGYSSLNTLKDVPAEILKIDMKFFENSGDSQRGGNIIESIVRMAKWLGMTIIAEGVEQITQADFLKSIGCYYIQGYLYSKPIPLDEYKKLIKKSKSDINLNKINKLENLDNNRFWDHKSIDTLIFNSYVGGASIFEYKDRQIELLRINDQYSQVLNGLIEPDANFLKSSILTLLDNSQKEILLSTIETANELNLEASCDLKLSKDKQIEYIHMTIRIIARSNTRLLCYSVINNLTDQRESERRELESARRLKSIMANIEGSVSTFTLNKNGSINIIFCNEKAYSIFGYSEQDIKENKIELMSCIIPEDFQMVIDKLSQLQIDGKPITFDYRAIKKNHSQTFIRATCSLMETDEYNGKVITAVQIDITEKKFLEEQFQAILENIYGGVSATYIKNGIPEFIIVNDKFYKMQGFDSLEDFEKCNKTKYDTIHPDDRERIKHTFETSDNGKSQYVMKYRIITKKGEIRYLHNSISIIHIFGIEGPVQLSVFIDITDQITAQQNEFDLFIQLQSLMSNIQGGISTFILHNDNSYEILYCNEKLFDLFGYTREQWNNEVENPFSVVLPADTSIVKQTLQNLQKEKNQISMEYRCKKLDGNIIWIKTIASIIRINEYNEPTILIISTDTTSLHKTK